MGLPVWTLDDFASSLQRHLPIGAVWPRDPDTVQRQVCGALCPTYVRNWDTALSVLEDGFPATTEFLLPEWEASLGLPDPCAGEDPTVALRRAHVVARLTEVDGPSVPSLTGFAAALGFSITIAEYAPAVAGRLRAGQPCCGEAWAFAWTAQAPATELAYFRAGQGCAGDPLATFGNAALACELRRISPAHTILDVAFAASGLALRWDDGGHWDSGGVWSA